MNRGAKNVVILVPSYQCEDTIGQTVLSIQQQGSSLDRVLCVFIADDASNDRTVEVALQTWKASVPLKVLRKTINRGEYRNVNEAVAQFDSDVEWFLIMHADNLAKPHWLSTLLDRIAIASESVGAIGTSYDTLFDDGRSVPGESGPDGASVLVPGTRETVAGTLLRGCWWHISSCAIRVATFRAIGGLPQGEGLTLKGDWDFMLRLLSAGWQIEHVPRSLMIYRQSPLGSSSLSFKKHSDIFESVHVFQKHHDVLNLRQIFSWHWRHAMYLARRAVRACADLNVTRLRGTVPATVCLVKSALKCSSDPVHWRNLRLLDRIG